MAPVQCAPLSHRHLCGRSLHKARSARRGLLATALCEALSDDDLTAIRSDLQQQRALGRDNFRAMAEAKAQRFAGIGPLIGRHATSRPWKANLTPFLGLYSHWADGHRGEVVCEDRLPATMPAMSRGELLTDLPLN